MDGLKELTVTNLSSHTDVAAATSPDKVAKAEIRIGQWSLGITAYAIITWLYDYLFFAFVIWNLGLLYGALVLTILTAILDYYCLIFYNSSKKDWLALEFLKALKFYQGPSFWKRSLGYLLRNTPTVVQIAVLTPYSTAFLTTALLREGAYEYSTMTRRDWVIFWTSFTFSQIYWIGLVWLGVTGLRELFNLIAIGGA